jgi:DinB superfamily
MREGTCLMARQLMTTEQILSILRDTPERLSDLTGDLTESQLHAAPEPGEWSVTEIAAHLRSCADMWGRAIETIAVTDHPTIRAVSPTTWIESTDYRELAFASSLQAFRKQRDQLLALLGHLPDQGWSRTATVLGGGSPLELTVHSYANRLARHERTHWRQVTKTISALLDKPAPAGSGRLSS